MNNDDITDIVGVPRTTFIFCARGTPKPEKGSNVESSLHSGIFQWECDKGKHNNPFRVLVDDIVNTGGSSDELSSEDDILGDEDITSSFPVRKMTQFLQVHLYIFPCLALTLDKSHSD